MSEIFKTFYDRVSLVEKPLPETSIYLSAKTYNGKSVQNGRARCHYDNGVYLNACIYIYNKIK